MSNDEFFISRGFVSASIYTTPPGPKPLAVISTPAYRILLCATKTDVRTGSLTYLNRQRSRTKAARTGDTLLPLRMAAVDSRPNLSATQAAPGFHIYDSLEVDLSTAE